MKPALIVCSYNRPELLRDCLNSLLVADLSALNMLILVDDYSENDESRHLLRNFSLPGIDTYVICKSNRLGIKDSLRRGFDLAFTRCDVAINLDADSLVTKDFLRRLLWLKFEFKNNIICGFNTTIKNRNPIIKEYETYFEKKYASGINMVINKQQYDRYIYPALNGPGNWDFEASKLHESDGLTVIVTKPSVVQHTGIHESTMGHISASEPPDVAEDFISEGDLFASGVDPYRTSEQILGTFKVNKEIGGKLVAKYSSRPADNDGGADMKLWTPHDADQYDKWGNKKLQLINVTLVGADCVDINRLIYAADKSCEGIEFGAVKLFSSLESDDPRVHRIRHLGSKEDYSWFIMKEMVHYIDTDYILIIQHDGYVLNPEAWNPEWLNYDLIGAIWGWYPEDGRTRVGNGGLSVRSKRLMEVVKKDSSIYPMNEDGVNFHKEEDHVICRIFGKYLQDKYGVKFAPEEEAIKFSIEAWRNPDPVYRGQFGFHGGGIIGINK